MADILQFRLKKNQKADKLLMFSELIDIQVTKAMFDYNLTPEEIVAVLANRTREAAESCMDAEKVKEFAVNHINKISTAS